MESLIRRPLQKLSRWIKEDFLNPGVDVTIFQVQSCRAASTSKARQQEIKISEILKRGCWSKENTSLKFYNKDIIKSDSNDFDYLSVVLYQMSNCFQGLEFGLYRGVTC